jgi:putative chitinase
MILTFPQLNSLMRAAGPSRVLDALDALTPALAQYKIDTAKRLRYFLATLAVESGELRYKRELSSGQQYEGNVAVLGNTEPGDGPLFRGWNWMQTTGRKNTLGLSLRLYGDDRLVRTPSLIDDPTDELCALAACDFWTIGAGLNLSRRARDYGVPVGCNLNDLADADDIEGIRLAVNGGLNGMDEFRRYVGMSEALITDDLRPGNVA